MSHAFQEFEAECLKRGLESKCCHSTHWQIRGGAVLVNFYPTKGKVYIANSVSAQPGRHNAKSAIKLALGKVPTRRGHMRKQSYREIKLELLARSRKCWWCPTLLTIKTATLEHILPLSRGGTNWPSNMRLACEPCNKARGNSVLPPPSKAKEPA